MGTHSGGKPANLQNLSAIIYVYSTPPVCVAAWIPHTNRVPQPGYSHANSILATLISDFIFVFLRWLANRAALQAMDQPFPPRPALFLTLMLPSRSKQLSSNLWITHPILQPRRVLDGSPTFSDTQSSFLATTRLSEKGRFLAGSGRKNHTIQIKHLATTASTRFLAADSCQK